MRNLIFAAFIFSLPYPLISYLAGAENLNMVLFMFFGGFIAVLTVLKLCKVEIKFKGKK